MGGVVADDDVIGAGGLIHCHAMFRNIPAVRPSNTRFAAPPHILAHCCFHSCFLQFHLFSGCFSLRCLLSLRGQTHRHERRRREMRMICSDDLNPTSSLSNPNHSCHAMSYQPSKQSLSPSLNQLKARQQDQQPVDPTQSNPAHKKRKTCQRDTESKKTNPYQTQPPNQAN
jgi:hypothetical protein